MSDVLAMAVAPEQQEETGVTTADPGLQPPPMYQVLMLNDDFTPMDFVVEVLKRFFHLSDEQATQIMLAVHYEGQAVCGVFTRDIAETKADSVIRFARAQQHPLLCRVQAVDQT